MRGTQPRGLSGPALAGLAALLFAGQDAAIKHLLAALPVWQVLAVRSGVVLAACLAGGGHGLLGRAWRSPVRAALAARAATALAAWWCFFHAARALPLGQLTTLYAVAPVLAAVLSAFCLGERLTRRDATSIGLGALGTLAAMQAPSASLAPVIVLCAALFWAASLVLTRWIAQREPPPVQLAATNLLFLLATGAMALQDWHPLTAPLTLWLLGIGALSAVGQWLLAAAARRIPVAQSAALQYTGLPWAFLLGYLVWGSIPGPRMLAGAAAIAASGAILLIRAPRPALAPSA